MWPVGQLIGPPLIRYGIETKVGRPVYWLAHSATVATSAPLPVPGLVPDLLPDLVPDWARELAARVGTLLDVDADTVHELLHDTQQLAVADRRGTATATLVEQALRAGVPVVPVAVLLPPLQHARVEVLAPVHFEGVAHQRTYDPAVVGEAAARIDAQIDATLAGVLERAR
jgi:hypothetical protein